MGLGLRIVWLAYVAAMLTVSLLAWTRHPSAQPDGAGGGTACACLGFLVFLVLAAVTRAEGRKVRPEPPGQGLDAVVPDDDGGGD